MADGGAVQFLSTVHGEDGQVNSPLLASNREFPSSSSCEDDNDMQPINGVIDFGRQFFKESKKLWCLAGPSIFTSFCQYGLITITQIFAGHLGNNQLAAVSMENSIISGFPYGLMYEMLGIYTQRTWVIIISMAFASTPLFVFATPVLKFLGQTASVSSEAGKFSLWMIPEHFAYAMIFPSAKFLQAQSKVIVLAVIAAAVLCLHAFLSWLLITVLGWGLVGAAVALDASWLCIAIAQFSFIVCGTCGEAWSGFSWKAFQDLWKFIKLSVASAMMMCINTVGWAGMVAIGLNVASSVRVSNELGRGHPRKSSFAVVVSGVSSLLIGLLFTLTLIISRKQYPAIFTSSPDVQQLVEQLTPLLGISIVFTNVQYTLLGVAIGAGWQVYVAYMSIGCYFLVGVPSGVLMAYKFKMGLNGLWCGMLLGLCLQTGLLMWMVWITNWNKECFKAEERLKQWREEIHGEETS